MDALTRLLQSATITEDVAAKVTSLVSEQGVSYEQALLSNAVPKDIVRTFLSEELGVESTVLSEDDTITSEVLRYIPEDSARHYHIVPLKVEEGVLIVGASDPDNLQVREVLNFISINTNL